MTFRALAIAAALLTACDSSPNHDPPELVCTVEPVHGVLMPLEIGNFWDIEAQKGNGEVVDTFRVQITSKLNPARYGIEGAFVAEEFDPSTPNEIKRKLIWKNEANGLLLAGLISESDTVLYNFRKYPFPSTVGQEFYSYSVSPTDLDGEYDKADSTHWSVFKTGHIVDTDVKQFATNVFLYTTGRPLPDVAASDIYEQIAPGIGIVARDWNRLEGHQPHLASFRHRLVDLCIMKPEDK